MSRLELPKDRPNDLQRLVLSCLDNGLTVRDATRVFGVAESTIQKWSKEYANVTTLDDKEYFMHRARELGASDEVIAQWFGFDRIDKVSMLLAKD